MSVHVLSEKECKNQELKSCTDAWYTLSSCLLEVDMGKGHTDLSKQPLWL